GRPHNLRMSEISDFTGATWGPERPVLDRRNSIRDMPLPPGLGADVPQSIDFTRVDTGALVSNWLPLPYPVTTITGVKGTWRWVPQSLSVASSNTTTQGLSYRVSSIRVEPEPERLL